MTALAREPFTDGLLPMDADVDTAVEFVVPVHNEERDLARSVRRLDDYLRTRLPYPCRVVIADNASTDRTWQIAEELAAELPGVRAIRLEEKGRGRALKAAWSSSTAAVVGYMDVDLSTDLRAIPPLVAPLLSGHSDLAIGTRLARGSRVVRGPKREVISRCYNLLLRGVLSARFSDAQCGVKAVRRDVAERLLPLVEDDAWFFDTELLVLAEEAGLRIHEVPVDWVDDTDSRVDILRTALDDLRGVARLYRSQFLSFGAIGIVSTLAYLLLYLGLRQGISAQPANAVALLLTAVANTAANRRLTFGVRGRQDVLRHQLQGLAVFALALAATSLSLAGLHAVSGTPSRVAELSVLVLANLAATLLRFFLLRGWVFRATTTRSA